MSDPSHADCAGCGFAHASAFNAYSYLVFEPFEIDDFAALNAAVAGINGGDGLRLTRILRTRTHERQHYVQHTATPYGVTMHALRRTQLSLGATVQDAYLAATGDLFSLHSLVAMNLADPNAVGRQATRSRAGELVPLISAWNSVDEVITALTYGNLPADYLDSHWKRAMQILGAVPDDAPDDPLALPGLEFSRSSASFSDSQSTNDRRAAHDDYFSVTDVLEGSARAADFQAALDSPFEGGGLDIWLDRSLRTPNAIASATGWRVTGPGERLVHDLSMSVSILSPDDISAPIRWDHFHPGLVLEAWLESARSKLPPDSPQPLDTADAFDLLMPTAPEWLRTRTNALGETWRLLPSAIELLQLRNEVTYGAAEIGTIDQFVQLTHAASLRLRAEDPLFFAYADRELTPERRRVRDYLRQPPVTVTPTRIHTYPVIDASPSRHAAVVASCIWRQCLHDLAQTGSVDGSRELLQRLRSSYTAEERTKVLLPALEFLTQSGRELAKAIDLRRVLS